MQVFIIDDDRDDFEILCEALSELKVEAKCLHAFDGIEALSSLKKEASGRMPDFIFLDVNMPRMGGMECLENIKQIPGLKDVPVIVYSTTTNPNEIDRYLKKGAHSFITKPNSFTVLISHLKKALFAS